MNQPKSIVSSSSSLSAASVSYSLGPTKSLHLLSSAPAVAGMRRPTDTSFSPSLRTTAMRVPGSAGIKAARKYLSCKATQVTCPARRSSFSGVSLASLPLMNVAGPIKPTKPSCHSWVPKFVPSDRRHELDRLGIPGVARQIPFELPALDHPAAVREHDLDEIGLDRHLLFASLSGRCRHPARRGGGRQDLRRRRGGRRHRGRRGAVLFRGDGPGRRRSRSLGEPHLLQQIRIEHDDGHREDEEEDDAPFHDDSSSADWVVAPWVERMALEQTPRRQDEAPRQTMARQ